MLNSQKTWNRAGVFAGLLVAACLASSVQAQQGTKVALLDISYIFQNNTRFKQTMDAMKADIEKFETYVKGRREQLQNQGQGLKEVAAGSPDYRQREAALAGQTADLQVEIGLKKKDIMEREARVYHDAYNEVVQHVAAICRGNNIGLVLRFNSADINANDRNSVLQGVNRSIVYQNQLDITQLVLDSINGRVPTGPATQARGPQIPQPRRQ